jgi:hypothetical protein
LRLHDRNMLFPTLVACKVGRDPFVRIVVRERAASSAGASRR